MVDVRDLGRVRTRHMAYTRRTANLLLASAVAAPYITRPHDAWAITQTVGGTWGKPVNIGLVAVNLALLPTTSGDVAYLLAVSGHNQVTSDPSPNDTPAALITIMRNGAIRVTRHNYPSGNFFCSGQGWNKAGDLIFAGGQDKYDGTGLLAGVKFDSLGGNVWRDSPTPLQRHWYGTVCRTASSDDLILLGGNATGFGTLSRIPEVLPDAGTAWHDLGISLPVNQYPWMVPAREGVVLPGVGTLDPTGTGRFIPGPKSGVSHALGTYAFINGVVYMISGGGPTTTVQALDVSPGIALKIVSVAPIHQGRTYAMAVALPNGLVGVFGGSKTKSKMDPAAEEHPEFYDPDRDAWEVGPSSGLVMTYHCNAVVLPWGDVAVTGSGENLGQEQPDHPYLKIYRPWYMIGASAPSIASAPDVIHYGSVFTVETPDAQTIDGVTLNGLGASTHSVNPSAVCYSAAFKVASDGKSITVNAPANSGILPRRHYILAIKRRLVTSPGKMLTLA